MEKENPLVSVLMTAFNRELYIAEAIESVLASTFQDFELIIVDDGSTDATISIAQSYVAKDSRVSLYVNDNNLGDYPNRNKAATYAKGKYLKYLDSDDRILDFGLAYCVEQMEKYPAAGLGMYYLYKMDTEESECWESEKIVKEHFFVRQQLSIGPTGTIIRRDKFIAAGGFDTRFGVASDMFFNIRFASQSPIVLLPRLFVYYRIHEGQEKNSQLGYLRFGYLYLRELFNKVQLPLQKKEVAFLYKKMQKRHSVNLVKYFWKTKAYSTTRQVMKETGFSVKDFLFSFFK